MDILQYFEEYADKFDAHLRQDGETKIIVREPLKEHKERTERQWKRIWDEKNIGSILEHFYNRLCPELSREAKTFLAECVNGIPVFHDLGKMNPGFQNSIMDNQRVQNDDTISDVIGTEHSILSAMFYIDYYFNEVKTKLTDCKEKKIVRNYILHHAYLISRHHGDLNNFKEYFDDKLMKLQPLLENKFDFFQILDRYLKNFQKYEEEFEQEQCIAWYFYGRLLFSMLVAADYYATSEFMNQVEIQDSGHINELEKWVKIFEDTECMKSVRKYQKEKYPADNELLEQERNINVLRTELLCDAEKKLREHPEDNLFYLEAPTGSGKSNTAFNLVFQMMQQKDDLQKVFYIYPFNTLVEQNRETLYKVFENEEKMLQEIVVVNSLTPIQTRNLKDDKEDLNFSKALLDRQFLNYPFILSTHVSLFDTLFGNQKESAFAFHQMCNSIVVLDEIQSYKNTIWDKMICFLKELSDLLNMKIIIMSATLPNLDVFAKTWNPSIRLVDNREKYFSHHCFKHRVEASYELLEKPNDFETLIEHMRDHLRENKKILVEFVKKKTAEKFYQQLKEDEEFFDVTEYMSGDDCILERNRILKNVKENAGPIVLVATQVVEAGVDIDMDIGYKNISKLDSEEQFAGRINRSCKREGIVYFFKMDDATSVYKSDIQTNTKLTLQNKEMRDLFLEKDFQSYYEKIMQIIEKDSKSKSSDNGIEKFMKDWVGKLNYSKVMEEMTLIISDNWNVSLYLARVLETEEGVIDGRKLWNDYTELLKNMKMNYAEKKVRLSQITSQMNYFIYQIKKNADYTYNDHVGDIFYVEDGEQYFDHGKINRDRIIGENGSIDFI